MPFSRALALIFLGWGWRMACAGAEPAAAAVGRLPAPAWVEPCAPDLAAPSGPEEGEGGVKMLLRDEQTHADEAATYRHYALRFLSPDGVQGNSTLAFAFDPSFETLALHQLVVHRGGQTADRLPRQEVRLLQREPNLEDQLYDGRLSATLILDDIRPGDVLEYAYSVRGANPIFAGHRAGAFDAQWRAALPHWRVRLLWPGDRPPPDIQSHGAVPAPQACPLDGGKLTEYRWEARDVPGRQAEGETPPWTDPYPWVQYSDFSSWNAVARWAAALFAQAAPGAGQPLPDELAREADALRALPDPAARAVGALRYVQDHYRYVGLEMGAHSHQPYPVATVCARRFGDCKDKANLLSALLRSLGFEADPALVETDYRHTLAGWHPTPFAFNHAVVRLRLDGRAYWLDPTREHQGGTLGRLYFPAYGKALPVRADAAGLEDVAPGGFAESGAAVTQDYRQERYGDPAAFTVRSVFQGRDADEVRGIFARTRREKLQSDYLNFYARLHPRIRSAGPVEMSDDLDKNEVTVRELYAVDDFWEAARDPASKRVHARFRPQELRGRFGLPETRLRTLPYGLDFPRTATETIRVRLPSEPGVDPEHTDVADAAFRFHYDCAVARDRRGFTLNYQYEARADAVPPERMPEYVAHVQRALDDTDYTVSVSRAAYGTQPGAAGPAPRTDASPAAGASPAAAEKPGAAPWPWGGLGVLALAVAGVAQVWRAGARTAPAAGLPEPEAPSLHRCAVCGRTERQHPELDFRVGRDGDDYCNEHAGRGRRAE